MGHKEEYNVHCVIGRQQIIYMAINWDWVPYFRGKLLTYHQYFALIGGTACLLLALISFLLYYVVKKYCDKKNHQYQEVVTQEVAKPNIIKKAERVLLSSGFLWLSVTPVLVMAVDVLPFVAGLLLNFGVLAGWMAALNYLDYEKQTASHYKSSCLVEFRKSLKYRRPSLNKKWLIVGLASILLNCLAYRTCLCFYNDEIPYYNNLLGFGLSSWIMRFIRLPIACPQGGPCQFYTTLPEDAITSVFVNVHTHTSVHNVTVFYAPVDTIKDTDFLTAQAACFEYKGLDYRESRNVHSALIRDLKPETKYLIKIFYDGQFRAVSVYKTFSLEPAAPIRMINAGDSGYTQPAIDLTSVAAKLKPDVFLIGGDVAYDDNMPACVFTWDYYLGMYGSLTTSLGYMMPIVLGVGNHDVGLNELPGINITVNQYGPAFLLMFPQHYDRDGAFKIVYQVPPINRRRTVFYHTFANMQYISLDSGYLQEFGGWQEKLLVEFLEMFPEKAKFVHYHVPVYSGCEDFDRNDKRYLYALFHWIPHFDQYKVMTVFQNHVHSFKRTKPLRGNFARENGTVYVGDGSFGAIVQEKCRPDRTVQLFEKQGNVNHFWLSVVTNHTVTHSAYNRTGGIIDNFTQLVSTYTT